jgi:ribosomal protein L37AE/L43A
MKQQESVRIAPTITVVQNKQEKDGFRILGKRGEPEKVAAVPLKQGKPSKCLAAHAGTFKREEEDGVNCDLCPPKFKDREINPSWHCSTCGFDFCQGCSAMARQFAGITAKKQKLQQEEEKIDLDSVGADTIHNGVLASYE